jgi:hypothetical protein
MAYHPSCRPAQDIRERSRHGVSGPWQIRAACFATGGTRERPGSISLDGPRSTTQPLVRLPSLASQRLNWYSTPHRLNSRCHGHRRYGPVPQLDRNRLCESGDGSRRRRTHAAMSGIAASRQVRRRPLRARFLRTQGFGAIFPSGAYCQHGSTKHRHRVRRCGNCGPDFLRAGADVERGRALTSLTRAGGLTRTCLLVMVPPRAVCVGKGAQLAPRPRSSLPHDAEFRDLIEAPFSHYLVVLLPSDSSRSSLPSSIASHASPCLTTFTTEPAQ